MNTVRTQPVRFLPPPYSYFNNIDVSRGNYDRINNLVLCELRVVAPEATTDFDITVGMEGRTAILRGRGENIWRVDIDRIYQFGTSPIIRSNCIEVYGYFRDSIQQQIGG